jgi:hypothetical protein
MEFDRSEFTCQRVKAELKRALPFLYLSPSVNATLMRQGIEVCPFGRNRSGLWGLYGLRGLSGWDTYRLKSENMSGPLGLDLRS